MKNVKQSSQNMGILSVELQFKSNLRIGLAHAASGILTEKAVSVDPNLCLGAPPFITNEFETHVVKFERYCDLPQELKEKKE